MTMPTRHPDDFLDDLFLGCAFAAYIEQADEEGGPPDCEATRRRAYSYYERELAARNGRAAEDGGGRLSDRD